MRTRIVAACALIATGLALLAWSASATLHERASPVAEAEDARPAGSAEGPDARAVLLIETPVLSREVGVDLPEPAAPLPVGLDHGVDTGKLPLGARVAVTLTDDAKPSDAPPTARTAALAAREASLVQAAPLVAAAAAFTLAGVATWLWGPLKKALALPLVGLYARITRAEVFDNAVRERIFAAIREHPGLSASDLAKRAGVSWGTTIYHLDVLEQNRMVTSVRNGRHRRYFENGAALTVSKEAFSVLQNPVTATVRTTLAQAPGSTQKDLAQRVGLSPQALHWHLRRLASVGLLRKQRAGRVVRHYSD